MELSNDIETEIIDALNQQQMLLQAEKIAGNVVKEEFHKGVVFGIRLLLGIIDGH